MTAIHTPDTFAATGTLAARRMTPVYASLLFTFLNSVSGMVTSGISYLTDQTYGFTRAQNYGLSLLLGVTYIAGALGAGPALRALRARFPGLSTRSVLAAMMAIMAVICTVPLLASKLFPPEAGKPPAGWPVWLLILTYTPFTGVLWPVVESYVSGGLRGETLRKTMGWWNVVWSSALVVSSIALAPFVKSQAAWAICGMSVMHILSLVVLVAFAPEPAEHLDEEPHIVPPNYRKLLVTFRMLLPMSYLVSTALVPYLPGLFGALEVPPVFFTIIAATWLFARVACFYILKRWPGWHGRWWPAVVSPVMLIGGFGICVFAQRLGGLSAAVVGLAAFGVGIATIYTAAIYYAMEVGASEVDAGGAHEALIGVGYAGGPLIGLAACGLVNTGRIAQSSFEPAVLGAVALVAAAVAAAVVWRVWLHTGRAGVEPARPATPSA